MIYFRWFPFAMYVVCFFSITTNRYIQAARKKHMMALSLGFAGLTAAVAQPIHNPWEYVVSVILALMACGQFVWEAAERQRHQIS